jgi:hypothetical protein
VAGDEHGPALGRERSHEAAEPGDAVGVEPVGRLIEDQHGWVAQKSGGDPKPLPHPERESAHTAPTDVGHPDQLEDLVDTAARNAVRACEPEEVVGRTPARMHRRGIEQRADLV